MTPTNNSGRAELSPPRQQIPIERDLWRAAKAQAIHEDRPFWQLVDQAVRELVCQLPSKPALRVMPKNRDAM